MVRGMLRFTRLEASPVASAVPGAGELLGMRKKSPQHVSPCAVALTLLAPLLGSFPLA